MKALLQRVERAQVSVHGQIVGNISAGLLVLLGSCKGDTASMAQTMARRVATYRIFADSNGKTNLDVTQVNGEVLVVSQFTLSADTSKGRRPSFSTAMQPEAARLLVQQFCEHLRGYGLRVAEGVFGSEMQVALTNSGPATYLLELK